MIRISKKEDKSFECLFTNSLDSIIITELDGKISDLNDSARKFFKFNKEEIIYSLIFDLFTGQERIRVTELFNKVLKIEKTQNEQFTILNRNGSGIAVSLSLIISYDSTNNSKRLFWIFHDSRETVMLKKSLEESEQQYLALIESSTDPIYILQDDKYTLVNSAWVKMFGYSMEEALSFDFDYMILVSDESKELIEGRRNVPACERPDHYVFKAKNKMGDVFELDVNISIITWNGREAVQGIYHKRSS